MTNMRRGFTMIELIFVIVIIGILAAVAIPKLAATRDDAKISNIIANTRTVMGDLGAFYTAQGSIAWDNNRTLGYATNVPLLTTSCGALDTNASTISPRSFGLCDGSVLCVQFDTLNGGILTVQDKSGTSPVCKGVSADPVIVGIVGTAKEKTTQFGGSSVTR